RKNLNWREMIKLAIDPELAREKHLRSGGNMDDLECSMCGEFCAIKLLKDALEEKKKE
ncbi:MAG: phosphomethylpyrimidine synthase, partial [Promethearchaeota archaeon]